MNTKVGHVTSSDLWLVKHLNRHQLVVLLSTSLVTLLFVPLRYVYRNDCFVYNLVICPAILRDFIYSKYLSLSRRTPAVYVSEWLPRARGWLLNENYEVGGLTTN